MTAPLLQVSGGVTLTSADFDNAATVTLTLTNRYTGFRCPSLNVTVSTLGGPDDAQVTIVADGPLTVAAGQSQIVRAMVAFPAVSRNTRQH
jgi:hypothetical protein